MTKIILTLALYLFSILVFSQDSALTDAITNEKLEVATTINIKVSVNSVSSNKGKVVFTIYDQNGFTKRQPFTVLNAEIIDGKANAVFKDVPKGVFSIICIHDKNDNNKMDFSTSGMPLEDYGASRNNIAFGPPQFNASKFEVKDKDLTFEIKF